MTAEAPPQRVGWAERQVRRVAMEVRRPEQVVNASFAAAADLDPLDDEP